MNSYSDRNILIFVLLMLVLILFPPINANSSIMRADIYGAVDSSLSDQPIGIFEVATIYLLASFIFDNQSETMDEYNRDGSVRKEYNISDYNAGYFDFFSDAEIDFAPEVQYLFDMYDHNDEKRQEQVSALQMTWTHTDIILMEMIFFKLMIMIITTTIGL